MSIPKSLSPQEIGERFNLLAADAKEYAVFIIDLHGKVICWNPGAEHIFGYQSDEILGKHFACFFSDEGTIIGQAENEIKSALSKGITQNDCWQVRKDGTTLWCHVTITPLLNENKEIRSFARVIHNLTESEDLQTQRKRADGLGEANRNKEEFMALLSHELRNPLSPIINAMNIIKQMKTNEPIIEQAGNIIVRQVNVMVKMVDDLLDISRITKGKLRLAKEEIDLRIIVNHAAESVRPLMDARKHDFSVSIPTMPVWIEADSARMEQVIVNLLNNAAKYTEQGGVIQINLELTKDEAIVRVKDNGVGIEAEKLLHVFELFTQIDGSLGRSYGGLGIGLALALNLVELHFGKLTVVSEGLGKGCEFCVKLPLILNRELLKPEMFLEKIKDKKSLKILIVEDNIDSGDSMGMLLRLCGHDIKIARDGLSGLEVIKSFTPDLFLLDIGLPKINGYELCKKIREVPRFAKTMICAMTGFTPSEADRNRQQDVGFNHHYVKPVELKKLLELFATIH